MSMAKRTTFKVLSDYLVIATIHEYYLAFFSSIDQLVNILIDING